MRANKQIEKTLQRVREVIRRKHLALATEECYCGWIARYCAYVLAIGERGTSEYKFERWLTSLAQSGVSATTQNQAFCAIVFLYKHVLCKPLGDVKALRAKRRIHVRHAPGVRDVAALLNIVEDIHDYPTRLVSHLLYGCGLRVSEPLNLRVKDVLLEESRLIIRQAKGGKDRVVALPDSLTTDLRLQLRHARYIHERDKATGVPVALPDLLAKKYPRARFAWQWAWLFPSHTPCCHPRTRETVRWRQHEANVQRSVKAAAEKLGLEGITPHCLRHCYATHTMDRGASIHDVQAAMGHASIETTAGYLHAHAGRVPSPLAFLPVPQG